MTRVARPASGSLVVAGGDAPPLLEAVDEAFHGVAGTVGVAREARLATLAGLGRDHRADFAAAAIAARLAAGVSLVARHRARAQAWPAAPGPADGTAVEQGRERLLVMRLAGREHEGDSQPGAIAPQVQLGGEAAARAAKALRLLPPFAPAAC